MTKLIFGCGFLGCRVVRRWRQAGHCVAALTRSADRARELAGQGIAGVLGDVTQPETLVNLPRADTVLYAVGWDPCGAASRWQVYVDGLRCVLAALPPPRRLIYISSTGVYGDSGGAWVDEQSPCDPTREAGRAFLAAEKLLGEHPIGERSIVLRMAGIYGPKRLLREADLRSGRPMPVASDSMLNLIHVDDAVAAVLAAEERAEPPCRYLVSDGSPVERRDYFSFAAKLLRLPPPRFTEPSTEERLGRHEGASKRVDSGRIQRELGLQWLYPSYREGLTALLGSPST